MIWTEILALLSPVITLISIFGGYLVLRSSMANTERALQERVRETLVDENQILQSRVNRLEQENKRLHGLMIHIIAALKKIAGIELEIDEDMVIFRSQDGKIQVSRLQDEATK
jgi:cell division protein FtsB